MTGVAGGVAGAIDGGGRAGVGGAGDWPGDGCGGGACGVGGGSGGPRQRNLLLFRPRAEPCEAAVVAAAGSSSGGCCGCASRGGRLVGAAGVGGGAKTFRGWVWTARWRASGRAVSWRGGSARAGSGGCGRVSGGGGGGAMENRRASAHSLMVGSRMHPQEGSMALNPHTFKVMASLPALRHLGNILEMFSKCMVMKAVSVERTVLET